jgi:PAS domain-containing protein
MRESGNSAPATEPAGTASNVSEDQRQKTLLKTGALQTAIMNSANFSSIATDERGIIQIFNLGAEHMLGYAAGEVVNRITPADISDPQELVARALALSIELDTPIAPGFEAMVFTARRSIEDVYELTYIRKDGSRLPAVVSVTALQDVPDAILGFAQHREGQAGFVHDLTKPIKTGELMDAIDLALACARAASQPQANE